MKDVAIAGGGLTQFGRFKDQPGRKIMDLIYEASSKAIENAEYDIAYKDVWVAIRKSQEVFKLTKDIDKSLKRLKKHIK